MREKRKTDKLERLRIRTEQERKFGWHSDEEEEKGLRIVVLSNMFSQKEASDVIPYF